ncbi:MAG: bifunctional diguanylate cyclase/phosphodiesterase [Gammaproteobacteria bacterium]|nr:bifunctional diguanylate cyclase/phosphodiesterase [Gammaproteobacteria bacterium]
MTSEREVRSGFVEHGRYVTLLGEIEGLREAPGTSAMALLLVRVYGLRNVNGQLGYQAGDRVLRELTERLVGATRGKDRLLRVGATSFALLIRNPLHAAHARLGANKLLELAEEPIMLGDAMARLTARIGISLLPELSSTPEELLRQSEVALHSAEADDVSCVMYQSCVEDTVRTAFAWFDLESALERSELEMRYQPQVNLATGELVGAEALLRWRCPRRGVVPPAGFLPAIENTRGMRLLLPFLLNNSMRTVRSWLQRCPALGVSVNISAANLDDPDLVQVVSQALSLWSYPAAKLVLEVTESSVLRDPDACITVLHRLRALGIGIAIDDFGTGYSSLSYLSTFPADELKIDGSFVKAATVRERDRQITEAVVRLGHALDLRVVAEGIEDSQTAQVIAAIGCDLGQGYHFGAPLPADEFAARWFASPARIGGAAA